MSQAQAIAAAAVKPMISQEVLISMVEETIWVNFVGSAAALAARKFHLCALGHEGSTSTPL